MKRVRAIVEALHEPKSVRTRFLVGTGRFFATIPPPAGPLGAAAHSRIPIGTVHEAKVRTEHRHGISCSAAVLLHQDAKEDLEHNRDSLSEKGIPAADDPEPGRSCSAHRCSSPSLASHSRSEEHTSELQSP